MNKNQPPGGTVGDFFAFRYRIITQSIQLLKEIFSVIFVYHLDITCAAA
jgi:hypothetical protein